MAILGTFVALPSVARPLKLFSSQYMKKSLANFGKKFGQFHKNVKEHSHKG
jgi:hypothetical protein